MVKMDYVWDRTVEFLGENLSAVLPFAVLGIFLPTSIMNALNPLWSAAGQAEKLGLAVVTLRLVLVMLWGSLAISALVVDPAHRSSAGSTATRRLPAMIGAYALIVLVIAALAIPITIVAAVAGVDMAAVQAGQPMTIASPGAGWGLALYGLLFVAVLLVGSARLLPLSVVVVAERRGAGAITQAWRLTRGMTWRLIGVTILYYAVSTVAGLAMRTVFGSVLRLFGNGDGPITLASVLTGVAVAAVSAGFTTLAAVFAAKLYVAITQTPAPVPSYQSTAKPS